MISSYLYLSDQSSADGPAQAIRVHRCIFRSSADQVLVLVITGAEFVKLFFQIGDAARYHILCASSWVPQQRRRVYIIVMRWAFFNLTYDEAMEVLGRMLATSESMSSVQPLPWSAVLRGNPIRKSRNGSKSSRMRRPIVASILQITRGRTHN